MTGSITIVPLDLADPASIDVFAEDVSSRLDRLELLINNAAIMATPLARDARGYESQFATNHLGHFQLTARLWSLLTAAEDARVVVLSSSGHSISGPDFDDINFEHREYNKWIAHGQAKSANALFALWLDRLRRAAKSAGLCRRSWRYQPPLQRHLTMEEQIASGWFDEAGNLHGNVQDSRTGCLNHRLVRHVATA